MSRGILPGELTSNFSPLPVVLAGGFPEPSPGACALLPRNDAVLPSARRARGTGRALSHLGSRRGEGRRPTFTVRAGIRPGPRRSAHGRRRVFTGFPADGPADRCGPKGSYRGIRAVSGATTRCQVLAGAFTGTSFGHGTARAPRPEAGTRAPPHLRAVSGCRSARGADERFPPADPSVPYRAGPRPAPERSTPPEGRSGVRAADCAGQRAAGGPERRDRVQRRVDRVRGGTGPRPWPRRGILHGPVVCRRPFGAAGRIRPTPASSAARPAPAGPEPGRTRRRNQRTLSPLKGPVPFSRRPIRILLSPLRP